MKAVTIAEVIAEVAAFILGRDAVTMEDFDNCRLPMFGGDLLQSVEVEP